MYEIISALKQSELFSAVDIIELVDEESVRLIKAKAKVLGGSVLHITELHTINYEKYSYHWQKEDGKLIIRWDNSPHWRNLKTFPYHRHEEGKVFPSHRIDINEVIDIMKEKLSSEGGKC